MIDLKPCPFCGGQAEISVDPEAVIDTQGRKWAYTAVCERCCEHLDLHIRRIKHRKRGTGW